MLDDSGYKFKLNFDEELWSEIAKKSIFQKKIHVRIQHSERISHEERMYL